MSVKLNAVARIKTTVNAMPYVNEGTYKPAWAQSKAKNAAKLRSLLAKSSVVGEYPSTGAILHKAADKGADFYFVYGKVGDDPELIQYGVRVVHFNLKGALSGKACGQVSVWRNLSYYPVTSLPAWVFKTILYPKYHALLSDNSQSPLGRTFWVKQVLESLGEGLSVFALESETVGTAVDVASVHPITSVHQMQEFYSMDQDYSGFYYRFLISGPHAGIS